MLHNPESLWCRVLKGKYFPNSIFLKATKGRRASWAWNSMLHGRDVVLKEGVWLVANGDDIDIRNTNWLADGGPVILNEQCHVTKVGELIDHTNHKWNLPLISQLFTLIEVNRVPATLIRWTLGNDEMRWPHSSNGILSVKSVYHALKNQARAQQNEPSTSSGISSKVWMVIWHTMMPQKIKKKYLEIGS